MNRDRRKVVANIFADAAKYALTVGVIGSILSGKFSFLSGFLLALAIILLGVLAYFITPKDKEE
jgi:hypothetical protein